MEQVVLSDGKSARNVMNKNQDTSKLSLLERLQAYGESDMLPMHMPGHKRNQDAFPWLSSFGAGIDITEIAGFDNLNDPEDIFYESQKKAAAIWGAKKTFFLVNGSSGGILAAVRAAAGHGENVIVARNCHKSVYNALELCCAIPHYLVPEWDDEFGLYGSIRPEMVSAALDLWRGVKLVVITSPTYDGVCSDIQSIAKVCHAHGAALLVDAAHGAHLGFGDFPESALHLGADLVVQSLHKTMPSLTQTALLHWNSELVDEHHVARQVAVFQSSSPSYILSASIDGCVRYLEEQGDAAFSMWSNALEVFHERVKELKLLRIPGYGKFRKTSRSIFRFDRSKILISTRGSGINGRQLADILRECFHIETEMAAVDYVLAMTGMGDDELRMTRLADALVRIDSELYESLEEGNDSADMVPEAGTGFFRGRGNHFYSIHIPAQGCTVQKAMRSKHVECTPEEAVGRVCAEYVWAYPPGIPILIPGERVDEKIIREMEYMIAHGVDLHSTWGSAPQKLYCLSKIY